MIVKCKCPKCGRFYEDYWDYSFGEEEFDGDEHWLSYRIKCDCGCYFSYTEKYKLIGAEVEEI